MLDGSSTEESDSRSTLADAIERAARLLPAQGPISIFIHHNTLHAFEDLPFEEAVERAARRFGCQPYLSEQRYRAKLAAGRILAKDVERVLVRELGDRGVEPIAGIDSRFDLWRRIVLHGIPEARGRALGWLLEETPALSRYRSDVPRDARAATAAPDGAADEADERGVVRRLWEACLRAVPRAGPLPPADGVRHVRHRDLLLAVHGMDSDASVHPPLIRFLAAYLDQGLAYWAAPARDRGLHGCFLEVYRTSLAGWCGPWARQLPRLVAEDRHAGRTTLSSLAHSLAELGVPEEEWTEFLIATLLALRGWAGMVRQLEERPDRVPARELPATLAGYLAVYLLFERAALEHVARHEAAFDGPLSSLRTFLAARLPPPAAPSIQERAWSLFHVAQLCGLDGPVVDRWSARDVRLIESELAELDHVRQQRVLHLAYEWNIRRHLFDALVQHVPRPEAAPPAFQAVFCLDEREESFRRHLEETDSAVETFGTAGFFGVAMYHQSATDAHPRPLCPVAIRPEHYVAEVEEQADAFAGRSRRAQRRAAGFLGYNVHVGSRMLVRGAVLMTLLGGLTLVPLVLRVVFPWLASRLGRVRDATARVKTRLRLDRSEAPAPPGTRAGFTVEEMAAIVRRVLEDAGMAERLSRLVLLIGHGSISLNNPHESAHDCGACGGGRGGPNARAFAQMANDPRVRRLLADEGLRIGSSTWFVGAERNTCTNAVTFFDEDLVPDGPRPVFARAREAIDAARRREAHERCRRFDGVPSWYPPLAALAHVEGRAADLAQPRPEYGHATNAFCIVGRRVRTTGLFLDRRAFLVSYDPTTDAAGEILTRLLAAVVPVVAGISLEYYFSSVDPTGYGCGTKLPHNVTSLLGVMDGAQSDLRTGLPWQMVEIHEPTRLTVVVEAAPDRLEQALRANPSIARLVRHRWIRLACLDPHAAALWELGPEGFVPHAVAHVLSEVVGESVAWYQGKRGPLPPVSLRPAVQSPPVELPRRDGASA